MSNYSAEDTELSCFFFESGNIHCALVKPIRSNLNQMSEGRKLDQSALISWMSLNNVMRLKVFFKKKVEFD